VRVQMMDRRALMQLDVRVPASAAIVERIASSPAFQVANAYCSFVPMREEVQVAPLAALAGARGCRLYLPAYDETARCYRFREWDPEIPLCAGRWNIHEPQGRTFSLPAGDVCVVVPGLAFDRSGMRVGYGGGYFDRMLGELRSVPGSRVAAIGVAFAFQVLESVPHGEGDEAVDLVVTESEWIQTTKEE